MGERIGAGGGDIRIGRLVEHGGEERVRIARLAPAAGVEVQVGIRLRVPDIVIARVIEQIVDQAVAVGVVHRAVGEHEPLESAEHGMPRRADE